jgi:replicative DNA helicase
MSERISIVNPAPPTLQPSRAEASVEKINKKLQESVTERQSPDTSRPIAENEEVERRFKYMSEYERPLLTVALKDPLRLAQLRHKITDDHFLFLPNKIIYKSLCMLTENPEIENVDLTTLHIECNKSGFESSGVGPQYLMLLDQGVADDGNFGFYLNKVEDAYRKYKLDVTLRQSLTKVEKNAKEGLTDSEVTGKNLIDQTVASVTKLNLESSLDEESISVAERALPYVEERASGENIIKGLPTGFSSLDKSLNGLLPGTLTVVGGRAKDGKSTMLMNIVEHLGVAAPDKDFDPVPILIISTEMYTDEDISRLIAINSYVEERKIANGLAWNDGNVRPVLESSLKNIRNAKIYHRYMPSFNAEEVCSLISYHRLRYGIELAVFDYIKMETKNASSDKREDQILGDITNALKMSAGKLEIPVLTACQINTRSDRIADSDRIARYADAIVEFRPKDEDDLEVQQPVSQYGTHWITITFCRRGAKKRIPVSFYKPCLKMIEAEYFTEEEEAREGSISLSDSLTTPNAVKDYTIRKFEAGVSTPYTVTDIVNAVTDHPDAGVLPVDDDDMF